MKTIFPPLDAPRTLPRTASRQSGSAIIAILGVLALISLLLFAMLHGSRIERVTSSSAAAGEQSYLVAESGATAAEALLIRGSSNRPAPPSLLA